MFRPVLITIVAAAALAACTVSSDRPYRSSASNPPGWVDNNRDGIDDRTQSGYPYPSSSNPPGWVDNNRDGVDDRTQSGYPYPSSSNPPGWIDTNRNGVDDRVEQQRRTSYRSGGYYDSYGNWRSN